MTRTTLLAIGLAALLVTTGAAVALPGQAAGPAQEHATDGDSQSDAHAADSAAGDGDADVSVGADAAAPAASEADGVAGPPADLPAQVPDFVSDLHDTIRQYLDGSVDDLGQAIQDVVPDDEEQPSADGGDAETASA